ncbi:MAG: sugar ABC transporter ATP-binding protein, partial [Thermobispora bispora]|nr:sugar ABC transporter ATP-binding protein [Thermobispora bispora]
MRLDKVRVAPPAAPPVRGEDGRRPIVAARGVTKTYGRTRALAGVDLEVRSGEVLGLVGHNGAGKSTLMRIVAGLEDCDGGTVTVHGQEASGPGGRRPGAFRAIRMAYQETSLCPELTVAENIWVSSRHCLPRARWRRGPPPRVPPPPGPQMPRPP